MMFTRIKKIWTSPAAAPIAEPLEISGELVKSGTSRFFGDVTSKAFLRRAGILAGILAGAGTIAVLAPSVALEVFVFGLVQIPIAIFQDSLVDAFKKKIARVKESPKELIKLHPRAVVAGVALAVGGIALATSPFLLPTVLSVAYTVAKTALRIPVQNLNHKAITAYKNQAASENPSGTLDDTQEQVVNTLGEMSSLRRREVFEELQEKFGTEFESAATVPAKTQAITTSRTAAAPSSRPDISH
jgi:hypothetical protein